MNRVEFDAFLASVRRTRFVDYLDPLGETAQAAFERRLQWARVSQHDPAYADEALFLLRNEDQLRATLIDELDEDDWVQDGGSDFQYGGGSGGGGGWVEEDRKSNAIFHAVELTDEVSREFTDEVMVDELGDEDTDDPPSIAAPGLIEGSAVGRALAPTPPAVPTRSLRNDTILPEDPEADEATDPPAPGRTLNPTPPPLGARPKTGPVSLIPGVRLSPNVGPVRDDTDDLSDEGEIKAPPGAEELATAPSAMIRRRRPDPTPLNPQPTPAPAMRAGEAAASAPEPAPMPKITASERPPERSGPPVLALVAVGVVALGLVGGGAVLGLGLLGGMAATGDDATDPPVVAAPAPAPDPSAAAVPVPLPEPPAPADVERAELEPQPEEPPQEEPQPATPEPAAEPEPAEPVAAAVAPEPQPAEPAEPQAPAPDLEPTSPVPEPPAPEPVAEPEPEPAEPEPEPAEPEPELDAPELMADPEPALEPLPAEPEPAEPEPTDDAVAVAPEAEPPAPEPATPAPEPVPAEPEPAEVAPAPAPVEAPAVANDAPSVDIRGLWLGTADGRGMKLTIQSQGGDDFTGTAEIELEGGGWMSLPVSGKVDAASSALSFAQRGGEASFSGKVSGLRASGTFTLVSGHVPKKWSVVR